MKYFLAPVLVLTLLLGAQAAEAHTLETDGMVQGVMHITPAHKPTAGEPAHFEFFMSDKGGKFDPVAYTYTLEITGEGMATSTAPVTAHGSTLRADYTFLNKGEDYTATLTGSSSVSNQPNFVLDFDDIFVFPPGQHENPIENLLSDHWTHVLIAVLVILAFAVVVAWDKFVVQRRRA